MTASTSTSRGLERHHPYGREEPDGPYIDDFTIPLSKEMHDRIHLALRAAALDFPGRRVETEDGRLDYVLTRLQLQLAILADQ